MADGARTSTGPSSLRGAPVRLLVFSDLRIDSPYVWATPALAEERRASSREALVAILGVARQRHVDAIACAGDLFNRRTVKPQHLQWLAAAFRSAGVPILVAPGNEDFIGPLGGYTVYEWPENVTIFQTDTFSPVELVNGVTVWGVAHTEAHRARSFLDRVVIDRGGVNLALLHAAETVGRDREPYADPCAAFDEGAIERAGFDHALVGHYRETYLGWMHTYPGAPIAHDFGGSPTGNVVLLSLEEDGSMQREIIPISSKGLYDLTVDLTGSSSKRDVLRRIHASLHDVTGVIKVTLTGRLEPEVIVSREDVDALTSSARSVIVDWSVSVGLDDQIRVEDPTVRGQFIRDVVASGLPSDRQERVMLVGLRALAGSSQLEGPR